ncbi:hypothetical protein PanWU01x14_297980, partial [Parasponia andersonii]
MPKDGIAVPASGTVMPERGIPVLIRRTTICFGIAAPFFGTAMPSFESKTQNGHPRSSFEESKAKIRPYFWCARASWIKNPNFG